MPDAAPLWGCYINLDRSPDRAAWMQEQLARLGLDWVQRLPAVDMREVLPPPGCPLLPGAYACFHSHTKALEQAPAGAYALVLEDDTELCDQFAEYLHKLVHAPLDGVDVVFLECQPHYTIAHLSALWGAASRQLAAAPNEPLRRRARGIELLDARTFFHWGNGAYLVTPGGRERLLALRRRWLDSVPQLPLDRSMERALGAQELRGHVCVPFLATTGLRWHGHSTIGNDAARMPPDVLMLLRRLLYAGSAAEVEPMTRELAARPADPALAMFALVLREIAAWERASVAPRA